MFYFEHLNIKYFLKDTGILIYISAFIMNISVI